MANNRNRMKLFALSALEGAEERRRALPPELRDRPLAVIERSNDWGWIIIADGKWAFLSLTGKILHLPQQKVLPAARVAGIDLPELPPAAPDPA